MSRLVMTKAERTALTDALRDMRRGGIRSRDFVAIGASKYSAYVLAPKPRDVVRVRR